MSVLPEAVPLFPLPDAVLFPGVLLPLHVFGPRDRRLVRDVVDGRYSLIGVVLECHEGQWEGEGRPAVHRVGCAGQIVAADSLPDGRCRAVLRGVREFEVRGEGRPRACGAVPVSWRRPAAGSLPPRAARRLRALLHRYADEHLPESMRRTFDSASTPDDYLVNLAASSVRASALERQALLEAASIEERAERLCVLLQLLIGGHSGSTAIH